jgi:hypothetical protein
MSQRLLRLGVVPASAHPPAPIAVPSIGTVRSACAVARAGALSRAHITLAPAADALGVRA